MTCWSLRSRSGALALTHSGPDDPGINSLQEVGAQGRESGAGPATTTNAWHVTCDSGAPDTPAHSSVQVLQRAADTLWARRDRGPCGRCTSRALQRNSHNDPQEWSLSPVPDEDKLGLKKLHESEAAGAQALHSCPIHIHTVLRWNLILETLQHETVPARLAAGRGPVRHQAQGKVSM